jgi:hypothetical protein
MDEDGYPTEETLARVRAWDPKDFKGLAEFFVELWRYENYIDLDGDILTISTAGWSGHEELIGAINQLWRTFHWRSSRRGGHHVFTNLGKDPDERSH